MLLDRDAPENSFSKNHRKMKGTLLQWGLNLQVPVLLFSTYSQIIWVSVKLQLCHVNTILQIIMGKYAK